MRCSWVFSLLDRYSDGALDPIVAGKVAAHVESCAKCARELALARRMSSALSSEQAVQAPEGFRRGVMEEVYHEALHGWPSVARREEHVAQRGRFYRRLGLSFLLSAVLLSVSLVVPRASYPTILATRVVEADLSAGGVSIVRTTLIDADRMVQGALRMEP